MNTHVIRDCAHDMYDAPRLCGFVMVLCYKERREKGSGICCLVKTRYHKHARDIVRSSPDRKQSKICWNTATSGQNKEREPSCYITTNDAEGHVSRMSRRGR